MKVMLILVDGMRPDAMVQFPQAQALMQSSATALDAQTVFPLCDAALPRVALSQR